MTRDKRGPTSLPHIVQSSSDLMNSQTQQLAWQSRPSATSARCLYRPANNYYYISEKTCWRALVHTHTHTILSSMFGEYHSSKTLLLYFVCDFLGTLSWFLHSLLLQKDAHLTLPIFTTTISVPIFRFHFLNVSNVLSRIHVAQPCKSLGLLLSHILWFLWFLTTVLLKNILN